MASSDDDDDRSPLHDAAYRSDVKRLRLILTTCAVNPYDEGGERVDEAKYDSLIADITRKVDEMASLKVVPRASRRARKLRHALEADLDSDDDWTACS